MQNEPTERPMVTQRDIAKELGVSNATVSLALRDSSLLTAERKEAIQRAAQRMGYKPNAAATELSRYKGNSKSVPTQAALAWINAWQPPEQLRSYLQFDCYWKGATMAAEKLGYRLEEFILDSKLSPERLHQILNARGTRGILLPPQSPHPDWRGFPWENYSVVRFGRSLRHPSSHVVSSDHVANTMLAFDRMRELGYKRIGFVTNEEAHVKRGGHLSEAGFLLSQRMVPVGERVPICLMAETSGAKRGPMVEAWIQKNRVDAVLTEMAPFPKILARTGIKVPNDIGLACVNIMDIPVPAGIDQNALEIGRVGLLMLHSLITDNACGIPAIPRQLLVLGNWVDGPSLPSRL